MIYSGIHGQKHVLFSYSFVFKKIFYAHSHTFFSKSAECTIQMYFYGYDIFCSYFDWSLIVEEVTTYVHACSMGFFFLRTIRECYSAMYDFFWEPFYGLWISRIWFLQCCGCLELGVLIHWRRNDSIFSCLFLSKDACILQVFLCRFSVTHYLACMRWLYLLCSFQGYCDLC